MSSGDLFINTGNILSLSEAKTKASQNATDELIEACKIILEEQNKQCKGDGTTIIGKKDTILQDIDRKDSKITVKIFISSPKERFLKEALCKAFVALDDTIDSLVIAYKSDENPEDMLTSLQCLWKVVEEYVQFQKLSSVGLSDINTNTFIELFQWACIKPNIIQINLATCCVVPPALQKFTKENDIQLLTHSDPCQILPSELVEKIFGHSACLHWVVKYQIHLKCRGILASKGYLLYVSNSDV